MPTYVVEQIPGESMWRVFRVSDVGVYHRVAVYTDESFARLSALQLGSLAPYEDEGAYR